MGVDRVQRRMAAILAADVVGYSRLMGADEVGTSDDEFNGVLGSQWSWVREDAATWSLSAVPGYLRIATQAGDTNAAKNTLLQNASGDFVIETKIAI